LSEKKKKREKERAGAWERWGKKALLHEQVRVLSSSEGKKRGG